MDDGGHSVEFSVLLREPASVFVILSWAALILKVAGAICLSWPCFLSWLLTAAVMFTLSIMSVKDRYGAEMPS